MTIKVLYDIALLANFFNRFDCKTGIFRVIEEVMFEMNKREDIELTLIGLCGFFYGEDPLFASLKSSSYYKSRKTQLNCNLTPAFTSKLRLSNSYLKYLDISLTEQLHQIPKFAWKWIIFRAMRKFLYNIKKWDIASYSNYKTYDVFHSPYFKLPPEDVTGCIPRVLTVYDLIPVIAPEFVTSDLTINFKDIINSINPEKDWAVCISEYTKQELCEYVNIPPERVFVAPLAAADHFYPVNEADKIASICRQYNIPEGDYFLSLATPQPRKNLTHLIRCFLRLLGEQPSLDINLVLVGSKELGWMHEDVFVAAKNLDKYVSRVIFTGYIPDEDLSEIYSGAKAFIFPSLYEGFGLPPLEAMQCGTPVITSNTTSLPEVVGDAGILVDPKDEDSLCQAMLDVLCDSVLRQKLSQKGLERSSQFSWTKCAADTAAVYKTAVSVR